MGNQLAVQAARNQPDSVAELPNVVYKDALGRPPVLAGKRDPLLKYWDASPMLDVDAGGGRFFKSSLCVHDDGGLVVVKVGPTCSPCGEVLWSG